MFFVFFFIKYILNLTLINNLSFIYYQGNPQKTAESVVSAVLHYNDPKILAEVSEGLGDAMKGIGNLKVVENFAEREGGNMKK